MEFSTALLRRRWADPPPAPAREEGELSRDDLRALTSTLHRLAEKLGTAVDRLEAVAETLEGGGE